MTKRRTYEEEFKREAIRLVVEEGRKASEVENNLGIGKSLVSRWIREFKEDPEHAFPGQGRLKEPDEALRHLERENKILKEERDILKKAISIFSKNPNRYSGL